MHFDLALPMDAISDRSDWPCKPSGRVAILHRLPSACQYASWKLKKGGGRWHLQTEASSRKFGLFSILSSLILNFSSFANLPRAMGMRNGKCQLLHILF